MAKDWAGWMGAMVGVIGLGFAAQQYFDSKVCNSFLIKDKPVILSKKAIPDAVDKDDLQKEILSCRNELRKNDKNAVAYTNIGEATRRLGDLPVALIAQQEAVKLDPNLEEAKLGLGLVQADMGKTAAANQTIQDTLAQKPTAIAYFYQGVVFANQKDWQRAETSFRQAIELDSNLAKAHSNLGVTLGTQGKTAEAIAAFQKAISLNPNDAEAYYNLGVTLGTQGKTAEAIAAFQKAISLNSNLAEAYYNLGVALDDQGKTAEAIAAFQKVINLSPNDAEAYYNLGVALGTQGKTAEAIAAFQKAISLNPNYAKAYHGLGVALMNQGDLEGSISRFKKARDLYRAQGNTQQANKFTQFLEKVGNR